jgi:hypothetical protein
LISVLVDFDALHTRRLQVLGRRGVDELDDAIRGRRKEGVCAASGTGDRVMKEGIGGQK